MVPDWTKKPFPFLPAKGTLDFREYGGDLLESFNINEAAKHILILTIRLDQSEKKIAELEEIKINKDNE